MDDLSALKRQAAETVLERRELLRQVIVELNEFAEIGGEEVASCGYLCELLRGVGFVVEEGVASLPTAFVARAPRLARARPCVAFLVEYDALPGIGHGCGHDASAAASVGAALALAACLEGNGHEATVLAIGTPGEENLSCKIAMVERGVFSDVDAAMMVHAFDRWLSDVDTMALDAREYSFIGRTAHAAAAPEKGVNALDAVALTFHGINCLRQQIADGCRVHGVVTDGGDVPNVIPDHGQARFYIRASKRSVLSELTPRVDHCAEGAALATGCTLKTTAFERSVDDIRLNRPFRDLYEANLRAAEHPVEVANERAPLGSTDAGNLSHAVPTIHALGGFAPQGTVLHTREFAQAMLTDQALDAVCTAATAMAQTALDLVFDPASLEDVRRAFATRE